jgi:hypothetical protein
VIRDEPTSARRQLAGQIIQCGIAILGAWIGFRWAMPYPENPKVPLLAALISGFGLSWIVTRLYVLIRFGRKSRMTWDPNG